MKFLSKFFNFRNNLTLIFSSLIFCGLAYVHAGESGNHKEPKYATLEDLRNSGHAKNTLCITLLSSDAKPLQNVLILLNCENMIGGTGGVTNDEGTIYLSQLPNRKCRAHTRMIGAQQAEKEIKLSDDKTHNIELVSTLTYYEFKQKVPAHR